MNMTKGKVKQPYYAKPKCILLTFPNGHALEEHSDFGHLITTQKTDTSKHVATTLNKYTTMKVNMLLY